MKCLRQKHRHRKVIKPISLSIYLASFKDKVDEGHDNPISDVSQAELLTKLVTHGEGDCRSNELSDLCQ